MENKQPLSPHIQIYRWHISSLVSISHRITGIINIIVITLICLWVSLLLLGETGKNITPDKISGSAVKKLLKACDEHLREIVLELGITRVIGIGKYAEKRAKLALNGLDIEITTCWHPSPASPLANRNDGADWRANVRNILLGEHS